MKENQTVRFSVYNLTENATAIENCFVTELSFGSYDPEILALKLSENITLGADKNELITKASERGYLHEDKDNYLTIYPDKDSKLDHYVEFWFNEEESTTQVASITVRHEEIQNQQIISEVSTACLFLQTGGLVSPVKIRKRYRHL